MPKATKVLMVAQFDALAKVWCDVCDGCGHASKVCPTYATILEFVAGNPNMQTYWRRSLETITGPRTIANMKDSLGRKRLK